MAAQRICEVLGCCNAYYALGYCTMHYGRSLRLGTLPERKIRKCDVPGCSNKHKANGYCNAHYFRIRKHGNALGQKPIRIVAAKGAGLGWIEDHKDYTGSDCIEWPFGKDIKGYGCVVMKGMSQSASRVMCLFAHGKPPSEARYHAAHECGNGDKACMNPTHLSWKTPKENTQDSLRHGTFARGERSGTSKLTEKEVLEIRPMFSHASILEIADKFGMSARAIRCIYNGETWSWLK